MPVMSKADFLKAAMRTIAGHSPSRQAWERAKDEAKKKGLDVGTFKGDLGPALDSVRDIVENVNELMRLHNVTIANADKEWKDAIEERVDRAKKIWNDYQAECDRKAEKHKDDDHKKAWVSLKTALRSTVPAKVDGLIRPWGFKIGI